MEKMRPRSKLAIMLFRKSITIHQNRRKMVLLINYCLLWEKVIC